MTWMITTNDSNKGDGDSSTATLMTAVALGATIIFAVVRAVVMMVPL